MADLPGLTGRTRVRIDWLGRIRLQVEVRQLSFSRFHAPPRVGHPAAGPTHKIWRDARQSDLQSLEPPFVMEAPPMYDDARAEITRLTAEGDEARDAIDAVKTRLIAEGYVAVPTWKLDGQIFDLTCRAKRYDALLAERAGVSEAMVERMARAAHFGTDGLDYESAFCRENDAHWEHWWNEDREMHVAIGKNILAALATPVTIPVDREAIRAEAFEEAAKIADGLAENTTGPISKLRFSLVASAIRSAAQTEASR